MMTHTTNLVRQLTNAPRYSIGFFLCVIPLLVASGAQAIPFHVVIDPGHGGSDLGTVFDSDTFSLAEKDVTLALARQVAQQLRSQGWRVTLTRDIDTEVSLPARTALANRLKADVFLSLHMNSAHGKGHSPTAEGVETYILNNANDAYSRRLAYVENQVAPERVQEKSDVALILKDLRLGANLMESKRLACLIQERLIQSTRQLSASRPRDRGVKQALFHVLLGADMPSVLVEAGFLSHPRDRNLVLNPQGRQAIGQGIAQAITAFTRKNVSSCKIN